MKFSASSSCLYSILITIAMWSVKLTACVNVSAVGDFRRDFGMNVELQGVMQDASVMRISDNVHNKTRSLHCTAVSSFLLSFFCSVV